MFKLAILLLAVLGCSAAQVVWNYPVAYSPYVGAYTNAVSYNALPYTAYTPVAYTYAAGGTPVYAGTGLTGGLTYIG